jgi:antitoxin component of MazEF toxin-antitoxin module
MAAIIEKTKINQWGNGLALRLNGDVAKALGVEQGTPVSLIVDAGRLVVEKVQRRRTLDEMLAVYDRQRHGGEAMAFEPVGREVL